LRYVRDCEPYRQEMASVGKNGSRLRAMIPLAANGADMFIPHIRAVERRGLVEFVDYEMHPDRPGKPMGWRPKGYRPFVLTRAGELVCELLVEAGLMPAAKVRQRKAA
ncbi:MAG TPA: hypothetical protein VFA23_04360, partial [Dongiaceae bacterium]|nr:hypothetical protein [Dongiaceae bacterium]